MARWRIRGVGLVTCLGDTLETFLDSVNHKKTTHFLVDGPRYPELAQCYYGKVSPSKEDHLNDSKMVNADRNTTLVTTAARNAVRDAISTGCSINFQRTAVVIGTSLSIATSMADFDESVLVEGPRHCRIGIFPNTVMNAPASRVAIIERVMGANITVSSGVNSGIDAMAQACLAIDCDFADLAICGGTEALSQQILAGLYRLGSVKGVKQIGWPRNYIGQGRYIPSEGAVIFVISPQQKNDEHIQRSYCTIENFHSSFSPYNGRKINQRADIIARMIKMGVEETRIQPSEFGLILLNTMDQFAYQSALMGVKNFLKNPDYKCPILDIKSLLGESFAVAGPQLVLIALGYLNKKLTESTLDSFNINSDWEGSFLQDGYVLILSADSAGHNSTIFLSNGIA